MKKLKKVFLYASGGLLLLLLLAVLGLNINFYWRLQRNYAVQPRPVAVHYTAEALQQGRHLALVKGCNDCHGEDLGGKVMLDDPAIGLITAPNITKGTGGLPANYSEIDFIRALRHGLRKDNKSLLVMPAHETSKLSDQDIASLVAYCMKLTPVDRSLPEVDFNWWVRL